MIGLMPDASEKALTKSESRSLRYKQKYEAIDYCIRLQDEPEIV